MLQLAFLTGQSNPDSWALSPAQTTFLSRLQREGRSLHAGNFPYVPAPPPHVATSLFKASFHNTAQYVLSRRASFAAQHQAGMVALLSRHPHTVLLAGSCGLELLANLRLSPAWLSRVSVFAYGPVARRVPACRHVMVQGSRDWLSNLYFNQPDHVVTCGHMDYLQQDVVLALCDAFITHVAECESIKSQQGQDSPCE
jgi:hypothetical protein